MSLRIELVSPERVVFEGDAELVIARTSDGEIGFQPGHVPFVGNLVSSVVRVALSDGGVQRIAVHSGLWRFQTIMWRFYVTLQSSLKTSMLNGLKRL